MPKKSVNFSEQGTAAASGVVDAYSTLDSNTIKIFNEQREAKQLVDWVRKEYTRMQGERQKYERQWSLNMAFYVGKQNMQYFASGTGTPGAGRLITPPAPSYRSRAVTNRIRPIIRTELARITSNKPNASVVPASSEDKDLFAAQAGEQVWETIYSTDKLNQVFADSAFWLTICGTSFTKVWWDNDAMDKVTSRPGRICSAPVTPFHLYVPDLYEREIENQEYLINAFTKSVTWAQQTYGVSSRPTTITESPLDSQMMSVLGNNEVKPNSVLVLEVWIKPGGHTMFPQGGYITVIDNVIVAMSSNQVYAHGEYPFIKWDHIPSGMFYSDSVITDLIPLQREYNRTKNQLIESKNRMAKPQLIAPKGSVKVSRITTEPGQVIEYNPGFNPPAPLQMQPIPSYVMDQMQQGLTDMEDISAQHSVSKGMAPPGVTAATAISFLQERDDTLMTSVFQSVEAGWEKWAKQTLSHVVEFWEVPRIVSVTGLDGSFDAITLKGADLTSGTDIRIEAGSALPTSKAAKQALLMDMMKMGFIDPQKGLELMEMGGLDKLYDEIKIDERAAQRENLRMSKLDVNAILQHEQRVAGEEAQLRQMQEMQMQGIDPQQMQGMQPQGIPQEGMQQEGMQQPPPEGMLSELNSAPTQEGMSQEGMGMPQQGMPQEEPGEISEQGFPLMTPPNIVPVNTWDNHQVHIDKHNAYRKTQAFELLPDPVRNQFEAHVMTHAMALNQAAQAAMELPPPPVGDEMAGANNGSGKTPIGPPPNANQFGPPGTEDGALPVPPNEG